MSTEEILQLRSLEPRPSIRSERDLVNGYRRVAGPIHIDLRPAILLAHSVHMDDLPDLGPGSRREVEVARTDGRAVGDASVRGFARTRTRRAAEVRAVRAGWNVEV